MDDFLRGLMASSEDTKKLTKQDAESTISKYLEARSNSSNLKEGDRVVRNDLGLKKYRFPSGNQIAVCIKKYDHMYHSGEDIYDMIICCAVENGKVISYPVDSSFYMKEGDRKNVFNLFEKK